MNTETSHLIEPIVKNYLYNTLNTCHKNRVNVYFYALNVGVICFIVLIFGAVLYYCNKQKLTNYEKNQKMIKDQEYVFSKIRHYKQEKHNMEQSQSSSITNLPYTTQDL